jgi:hypothetical protein
MSKETAGKHRRRRQKTAILFLCLQLQKFNSELFSFLEAETVLYSLPSIIGRVKGKVAGDGC